MAVETKARHTPHAVCRPQEKTRANQVFREQGIISVPATTEPEKNSTTSTELPTTVHVSHSNGPINNKDYNDG